MLNFKIEGIGEIEIQNLVLDMNGTICLDGKLIEGVFQRLEKLKSILEIFLISADTFGTATDLAKALKINLIKLDLDSSEIEQKKKFIDSLDVSKTIAIGNGQNDSEMLKKAHIGIGIIGKEGIMIDSLLNAKVIVTSPIDALDLILFPKRLTATLRR